MAKRERRQPEPGEFEDPLSVYEPTQYTDAFLESLCEDAVSQIEHRPYLAVLEDERVCQALALMNEHFSACLVIVDDQAKPIGMFSERDVLTRVADHLDEITDRPIKDFMTPDPITVYDTDTPAQVLNVMVSGGFRHVPVVDVDERLVGIIGARRVTAYLQKYFPDEVAT